MNKTKEKSIVYVIKFSNDNRVRYLTRLKCNSFCELTDLGRLESAKTWKTEKGANKGLSDLLARHDANEFTSKWKTIVVTKITTFPTH